MAGKFWSEREIERLEALMLDGKSDEVIGKILSRPRGSVASKRRGIETEK